MWQQKLFHSHLLLLGMPLVGNDFLWSSYLPVNTLLVVAILSGEFLDWIHQEVGLAKGGTMQRKTGHRYYSYLSPFMSSSLQQWEKKKSLCWCWCRVTQLLTLQCLSRPEHQSISSMNIWADAYILTNTAWLLQLASMVVTAVFFGKWWAGYTAALTAFRYCVKHVSDLALLTFHQDTMTSAEMASNSICARRLVWRIMFQRASLPSNLVARVMCDLFL